MPIHPDLRRSFLLWAPVGALCLSVGVTTVVAVLHGGSGFPRPFLAIYAATMLLLGYTALIRNPGRARRASWLLDNVQPVAVLVTVRVESNSESTSYYADVRGPSVAEPYDIWSYDIVAPSHRARRLRNAPASHYADPRRRSGPAVMLTEAGPL